MQKFTRMCVKLVKEELVEFKDVDIKVTVKKTNPGDDFMYHRENGYVIVIGMKSYEHTAENSPGLLDSQKYRYESFLKGIGLEYNMKTDFLLTLLHEYGHIHQFEYFRRNDMLEDFLKLKQIAINALSVAFKLKDYEDLLEEGINVAHLFNFEEPLADNYALKHFIPIWKKLEDAGVV